MGDRTVVSAAALVMVVALIAASFPATAKANEESEEGWPYEGEKGGEGEKRERLFMLEETKQVAKTDAGEVRVVTGPWRRGGRPSVHIGFITMEPNTLFIPQYIDACLIIFVRRGEAKVGWIYNDEYVEKQLKMGDINHIPAGSAFFIVNTGIGQRLQIICGIASDDSISFNSYQPFYIAGGLNPSSVLSGFDFETLTMAFNVTGEVLRKIMTRRLEGPIVFMREKKPKELKQMKERSYHDRDDNGEGEAGAVWWWRKALGSLLIRKDDGVGAPGKEKGPVRAPDSYNLYERDPDFRNDFGWSLALDENDYEPLKDCGISVYLVNLAAGSMLAPHVNPTAAEFGVVIGGSGTVEVVFPNGTTAMNVKVSEGDVFWVPRYFPFCHIASRTGPFEFFGFTTSACRNHPQFLVGASSILRSMFGPELAAGFGVSEEKLSVLVKAQNESVILPTWPLTKEPEIAMI